MALAAKTARLALGTSLIDAQYLADRVIFINSKYVYISILRRSSDQAHLDSSGVCLMQVSNELLSMYMHVNLFVYFQTDDIIAINKPYGLPVHCKYMNERPGCFSGGLKEGLGWSLSHA